MPITTKKPQFCSLEDMINQLRNANLTIKWIAEESEKYFLDCQKLIKLNQTLGMQKFMEHLKISCELYKLEYLLQLAMLHSLFYEQDLKEIDN